MIRSLFLSNFQRHRKLKIPLGPGVTTIVGPSDVGKSAVVRALTWLAFGVPRGTAFMRKGCERAVVSLRAEGKRIRRVRGKVSSYQIGEVKLAAFGAKVPDEVSSVLKLSDLNFQEQHDPAFWFSKSPGQVSKELNRIVDLEVIDTTLANLASMQREAKAEERVVEERLAKATKEVRRLRFARALARGFERCQAAEQKAAAAAASACVLRRLVEQAVKQRAQADRLCQLATASAKLTKKRLALNKVSDQRNQLGSLLTGAMRYKPIELPPVGVLQHQADMIDQLVLLQSALHQLIRSAEACEMRFEEEVQIVDNVRREIAKFKGCPACARPF